MTKPLAFIIEDDAKLNQVFTLSIQEFFETESFTDGDSALARLAQATPHIVLVDLNLPGAPGHKIISHIRADERLRGVRILICSADDGRCQCQVRFGKRVGYGHVLCHASS